MQSDIYAEEIAQELLEISGESLLSGDLPTFRRCFELPLQLETVTGTRAITNDSEFAEVFESVRHYMKETGAVDFVRTVISASFRNPTTIGSIHVTSEIYEGGQLKRPAYPVRSTLKKFDSGWKTTSCLYVITNSPDHNAALLGTQRAPIRKLSRT